MLVAQGMDSTVVQVVDNNCINREVTKHKPTHVMIEALWVVPEKFEVLQKLHPDVKWIIRLHSETPFIANEGVSMDWIFEYVKYKNVFIAPNSKRMYEDLMTLIEAKHDYYYAESKIVLLPNYYIIGHPAPVIPRNFAIDIGCFGAIRPLKNQLNQAVAAIKYADKHNLRIRFHMNTARIENNGNNVLKNIRNLFANLDPSKYELVEHDWLDRPSFLQLVRKMDIGLQVSFSETFNIITADFVSQRIPVVVSPEINWVSFLYHASPNNVDDIVESMERALGQRWFGVHLNRWGLRCYNRRSARLWLKYLKTCK
jgi:hypothetical protein